MVCHVAWVGFSGFWNNVIMLTVYILSSFMVIIFEKLWVALFSYAYHFINEIILQFSARNSQIVSCCNMHIIMKLAFPLPPLIVLLSRPYLIPLFYQNFLE